MNSRLQCLYDVPGWRDPRATERRSTPRRTPALRHQPRRVGSDWMAEEAEDHLAVDRKFPVHLQASVILTPEGKFTRSREMRLRKRFSIRSPLAFASGFNPSFWPCHVKRSKNRSA